MKTWWVSYPKLNGVRKEVMKMRVNVQFIIIIIIIIIIIYQ